MNRTHCYTRKFNTVLSLCRVLGVTLYFSKGFPKAVAKALLSSSQMVDLVSLYFIFHFLFFSFLFIFFSFYVLIFLFLEHRVRVRSQDTENEVERSRTNDIIPHVDLMFYTWLFRVGSWTISSSIKDRLVCRRVLYQVLLCYPIQGHLLTQP